MPIRVGLEETPLELLRLRLVHVHARSLKHLGELLEPGTVGRAVDDVLSDGSVLDPQRLHCRGVNVHIQRCLKGLILCQRRDDPKL